LASLTFTALRDPAGNLRGFSEFSHDLSESKESGAKYRALLEAAPDAMVVVNQAGEIVLLNVQAEKQFGYSRDELVGQKVKNIIPDGFAERLIADGTRSAADALAQQIGTGIELIARRKDGSEFPIEIMLSPLENAEGILVTAAIRDISVRKDAEKHLARMEGRYRGLLEAAAYGSMIRECRRYFRCPLEVPAVIRKPGLTDLSAEALNISEGGMALRSITALELGSEIAISFALPGQPSDFTAQCAICWSDNQDVGIQFTSLLLAQKSDLQDWLSRMLEHSLPEPVAQRFRELTH
jgi:PAS domain S-box-containing protein